MNAEGFADAAWEALPESRRREIEERDALNEERSQTHQADLRRYGRRVTIGAALAFAVGGLVTSAFALRPGAIAVTLVLDAVLGAAAARAVVAGRGGNVRGAVGFGAAGFVSVIVKLLLGGLGQLLSGIGGAFTLLIYLAQLAGTIVMGYLLGMAVEWEILDREG
jgi:hypothetical protein